jgi:hypothetical protein
MRKKKLRYCNDSKRGTKEEATDMLQLRPVSIRLRMKGYFKCMNYSNQIKPRKSCSFLPSAASSARVVQVRFKFCICDVLTFFTNKLMHYYSMKRSTKKHRNAQESIGYGRKRPFNQFLHSNYRYGTPCRRPVGTGPGTGVSVRRGCYSVQLQAVMAIMSLYVTAIMSLLNYDRDLWASQLGPNRAV